VQDLRTDGYRRREELVDGRSARCAEGKVQLAHLLPVQKRFEPEVGSSRCPEAHVVSLVEHFADA
jgi:hypothetical protein